MTFYFIIFVKKTVRRGAMPCRKDACTCFIFVWKMFSLLRGSPGDFSFKPWNLFFSIILDEVLQWHSLGLFELFTSFLFCLSL